MRFNRGYVSPYFATNTDKMKAELRKPYILLIDGELTVLKDLLPILTKVAQTGKPLLLIAEDVAGEALATLVVNKLRGTLKVVAVNAPESGDKRNAMIESVAAFTGGKVISEDLGVKLENVSIGHLGTCSAASTHPNRR